MKYPIFYCLVKGRIISPGTKTKKNQNPANKERGFRDFIPLKFDVDEETILHHRSFTISTKYDVTDKDTIIIDRYHKISSMGFSSVKD